MIQIILKQPGTWKIGQEIRQGAMLLPVALLSFVLSFPTFILFPLSNVKPLECTYYLLAE